MREKNLYKIKGKQQDLNAKEILQYLDMRLLFKEEDIIKKSLRRRKLRLLKTKKKIINFNPIYVRVLEIGSKD
jgi:hypothetical protein